MATQQELALQIIAQLRVLDPSISADLGTPERKIIDTVGQALSDAQIDLVGLQGALDLDSKYGDTLDRFLALFGFARRRATYASGFVTFSRISPSTSDIRIPTGTQVLGIIPIDSSNEASEGPIQAVFSTIFDVVLPAGDLSVVAPIRANLPGAGSNVPANTITDFVGTTTLGITAVTNETPTSGGIDVETDDELKVRFKNQIFRNLAGTKDQYLALAAATAYTTKANVIGPVSRYREYVQVPPVDDSTSYDIDSDTIGENGNGSSGEWTTALSDVPYSKHIYTEIPYFVSNGIDASAMFYRPDVDFRINVTETTKNFGDTYRESHVTPQLGYSVTDPLAAFQPNITLLNVYTGTNPDVQAIRPGDVVLFEHSYLSSASRNNVTNGITNAVDLFIDGGNDVLASVITTRPSTTMEFVNDPTSKYHFDNYRRKGEAEHRAVIGNVLLPLFWQPVTDTPNELIVNNVTYLKNVHYWVVEDVSELYGTIRARNGLEFTTAIPGIAEGDTVEDPSTWTGDVIIDHPSGTPVPVENYLYDRNIVDLQTSIESNRQVTTDVLAHKARKRYFKLDITVMYGINSLKSVTDAEIRQAVVNLFESNYFGSVIQLSDLIQVIHEIPSVDNVRWSSNVPGTSDYVHAPGGQLGQVYETDVYGNQLTNLVLDQLQVGSSSTSEKWQAYWTGSPTEGEVQINLGAYAFEIPFDATAGFIQSPMRSATSNPSLTVTGTGTPTDPFVFDWVTHTAITYTPYVAYNSLGGGDKMYMTDFFLKDDELPALPEGAVTGDTVPGLIIRRRAQNTFSIRS